MISLRIRPWGKAEWTLISLDGPAELELSQSLFSRFWGWDDFHLQQFNEDEEEWEEVEA